MLSQPVVGLIIAITYLKVDLPYTGSKTPRKLLEQHHRESCKLYLLGSERCDSLWQAYLSLNRSSNCSCVDERLVDGPR